MRAHTIICSESNKVNHLSGNVFSYMNGAEQFKTFSETSQYNALKF